MTSGLAACCSVQPCVVHDPCSHLGQTVTHAALCRRRQKPFLWPSHLPDLQMVHSSQDIHAMGRLYLQLQCIAQVRMLRWATFLANQLLAAADLQNAGHSAERLEGARVALAGEGLVYTLAGCRLSCAGVRSLAKVAALAAATTLGEAGDKVLTRLPALLTYLTTCSQSELLQQLC